MRNTRAVMEEGGLEPGGGGLNQEEGDWNQEGNLNREKGYEINNDIITYADEKKICLII